MSTKVIENFINRYNHVLYNVLKQKQLKKIPFPSHNLINDKLIQNYSSELDHFIRNESISNKKEYELKKIEKTFPKSYFDI